MGGVCSCSRGRRPTPVPIPTTSNSSEISGNSDESDLEITINQSIPQYDGKGPTTSMLSENKINLKC